jgi:hypothetical protein
MPHMASIQDKKISIREFLNLKVRLPIPILTTGHAHALCSQEARGHLKCIGTWKSPLPKSSFKHANYLFISIA